MGKAPKPGLDAEFSSPQVTPPLKKHCWLCYGVHELCHFYMLWDIHHDQHVWRLNSYTSVCRVVDNGGKAPVWGRGQWKSPNIAVQAAVLTLGTDLLPHSAGDKCWNDNVAVAAVVVSDPGLLSSSFCSCTFFLPNAPASSSVRKSNWGWTRVSLG